MGDFNPRYHTQASFRRNTEVGNSRVNLPQVLQLSPLAGAVLLWANLGRRKALEVMQLNLCC